MSLPSWLPGALPLKRGLHRISRANNVNIFTALLVEDLKNLTKDGVWPQLIPVQIFILSGGEDTALPGILFASVVLVD